MESVIFYSVFAAEIQNFLNYRQNSGLKKVRQEYYSFKQLDTFICNHKIKDISFNRRYTVLWKQRIGRETDDARYHRINRTKRFFQYLYDKGYDVYVFSDIRIPKTDFTPHIYSEDEIQRYFLALDTLQFNNLQYEVAFPLLFRILLCCGTRIEETLSIRKEDVDAETGVIRLRDTKNQCERLIPLSKSLHDMLISYADKEFYRLRDRDYIFHSSHMTHIDLTTIHNLHVKVLAKAGIPYRGDGHGPRIHDWRHTFAVNSFKLMIDNGVDLYAALPVLSMYLGHKAILSTERYVRMATSMYPYIEERFKSSLDKIFTDDENN